MILVDTSMWIDHLRFGSERLKALLCDGEVLCHPFVVGELACGSIRNRDEILGLLAALPEAMVAEHYEVLHLIDSEKLHGRGLGWVDVHLLASAILSRASLWTRDKALVRASEEVGVKFSPR